MGKMYLPLFHQTLTVFVGLYRPVAAEPHVTREGILLDIVKVSMST